MPTLLGYEVQAGSALTLADGQQQHGTSRAESHQGTSKDQRLPRLTADDWELQQLGGTSLQLDFQDSHLSPALSLLPSNSAVQHNFTEYSLFQQSDLEFAPLRASPDISVASERFHLPPQDRTSHGSLSQHPLAQATVLSEDGASSCCSLSQHSISPGNEGRRREAHSPVVATGDDRQVGTGNKERAGQTLDKPVGEAEDGTFFLSEDISARHLLELLQKDVGMPSGSSSAVSSASETSLRRAASSKPEIDQSTGKREGPPGEASLSQQQTQQPQRDSHPDKSHPRSSDVFNITFGSRNTQPDDSSEALHRELLSEVGRSSCEAGSKAPQQGGPTPDYKSLAPNPTEVSKGKPSVTRTNLAGMPGTEPRFSAGYSVERSHRERDLWSSGNQTGIDGSYLGFLPQSQSTPGVFHAPPKSSVKTPLAPLSDIESNMEDSHQSSTRISPQPAVAVADFEATDLDPHHPGTAMPHQEEPTSGKVQALPCLNYMQKVDAWRANQSSGTVSLFDSLALQGFSGISPKKKAYDAVSDSLNRILTQQRNSLQQPPVSSATNQNVTQSSSSTARSGSSSPRRGEAVGSAPHDKDDTGSATWPSASALGGSRSHSSLSTVVTSIQQAQRTERLAELERSQTQEDVLQQPSTAVQPSSLVSLGRFSDVTLSNSQDSYNSGQNLGVSVGASSVISLEVDNYAPYWNSKPSTPQPLPRPRELNIEERIPLYLHNLGIDQSPSTILTPFAPRGPIREPEFSPTDLCTIKGSVGTPTKSTQPSEGGSPHKGEFSRSSLLSVDSSMSIPLSVDSLCPAVSFPEQTRASPSSDTAASQSGWRAAPSSQAQEASRLPAPSSSQNTIQLGDKFASDSSLITEARCRERDLESPLQTSHSMEQTADSSIGNKALQEIRKLLDRADNIVSGGSSMASSLSPAVSHLHSDDDIFLSLRKKTGRFQDSSFTSSSTAGLSRTQSSLLWARSSSDSMLTSDRLRESSIGGESMISSGQLDYPSTQALSTAPAANTYIRPQNGAVSGGAASSLLSKSARRAEPEGCSAAPPDNTGPAQPPVTKPPPAVSKPQPASSPTETGGVSAEEQEEEEEEEVESTQEGPVESSFSSPILSDPEQEVMSDGSSESSLAARVAKLLQSESPATMVSSTPSTVDQEESRAREWIKLKVSGQQCEPLELDIEDRKRIEEIKRELLFKNPIKSQGSTDTESSAVSSVGGPGGQAPLQPAETFTALQAAEDGPSHQQQQRLDTTLFDSTARPHHPLRQDLEARVQEIAAREGVTLPRSNPPALTSITISTCRRSTSPSPSSSPAPPLSPAPEPLHLNQLSTAAGEHHVANRQLPSTLDEEDSAASTQGTPRETVSMSELNSLYNRDINLLDSQSVPGNQGRQDAVGGQYDKPPPSSQGLDREDVNVQDKNTQVSWRRDLQDADTAFKRDEGTEQPLLSNQYSSLSAGLSTVDSPTRTGHISHLHLTLSPKEPDHSLAPGTQSSHAAAVSRLWPKEFVPLRHSSSPTSSPDEGLGLSSPPGSYEPIRARGPERADTSALFKTIVPQRRMTSTSPQSFAPYRKHIAASPRSSAMQTPAVPVLLPYKPHGSEELFYVPQTEADVSSTNRSDTTMESSHPGSDDAVPPLFSSEVLGKQDPGLDRGVTIKHTEGIYSKRLKTASFKMQTPEHRDVSVAAGGSSQISASQAPQPSSQVSAALTRLPLSSNQGPSRSRRDQGTSPVQFLSYNQSEASGEAFRPVHTEMHYSRHPNTHLDQTSVPQARMERERGRQDPELLHPASRQSGITLDQLWRRFSERWSLEESRPTSEREASLLERLERLSRLIHSTTGATSLSELEDEAYRRRYDAEQELRRREEAAVLKRRERKVNIEEVERSVRGEAGEIRGRADRKARGGRKVDGKPSLPRQAWPQELQEEETPNPTEEDSPVSLSSSLSHSQHLCPAERDESETLSTMSSSMSTIDTARLVRAFGAHRVRHLKTGSSLSKLYSTIDKQREGREQRRGRGRSKEPPHIVTPSDTTDDSIVAADSASSTSTYTLPSRRGPSQTLAAKKAVKLVSKGIQTGDLEIVSNGTRRHTRDVGTTFPSPGEARAPRQLSSSSSSVERGRGGQRTPSKTQGFLKQRKSKRSQPKSYPQGVSWFVSAEDLRAEARKENQPEEEEEEPAWRPSAAWFEPYSRTNPWREPLRQRQVQEDRHRQLGVIHVESDPEPRNKPASSGLVRISLQEALEMRRPEFISQSRKRTRRLALQAEERKLQADFRREREELFDRPGRPGRLPRPMRRAVPRKEMIQRSKQIYENLPEVQRRKEEERRKAEYHSYRLNAQLYNKRITNRVLGRRTPWQ
ncbi:uro-adherence factor A [Centroberyx affinis]|uniref:uro-adherence factor A n=1 Tax=Centroberyx affinis TaxID=166261 RepID=UPI003A5C5315